MIGTKNVAEWVEILDNMGIPCSPINNIENVVNHPQVVARGMIATISNPKTGEMRIPGCAIKFLSGNPVIGPAPMLGEHTEEVLKEFLNIDHEGIGELREKGAI